MIGSRAILQNLFFFWFIPRFNVSNTSHSIKEDFALLRRKLGSGAGLSIFRHYQEFQEIPTKQVDVTHFSSMCHMYCDKVFFVNYYVPFINIFFSKKAHHSHCLLQYHVKNKSLPPCYYLSKLSILTFIVDRGTVVLLWPIDIFNFVTFCHYLYEVQPAQHSQKN